MYRARLDIISSVVVSQTAAIWQTVDPTDINATLAPALDTIQVALTVAQAEAARSAELYLSAFYAAELGELPQPVGIDATVYAGVTRDGRPTSAVLALASVSMLSAVAIGTPLPGVLAAGLARTIRTVRTESVDAARTAQAQQMDADERVAGYYRASSSEPCGACLGVAGTRFATAEIFALHGACRCTAEPIMADSPDNFSPATGEQVFAQMDDATANTVYGDTTAEMLRDGAATPADLVTTREAHSWGAMLFQTPVSSI